MARSRASRRGKRVGRYRSQFEADVAADLDARGVEYEYEDEEMFYEIPRIYVPDFTLANGIRVEVKGWFPAEDRRKMLEVKRANPGADIRLVFQNAKNKVGRGERSMTYGQWATRYGFKWAEKRVPYDWGTEVSTCDDDTRS